MKSRLIQRLSNERAAGRHLFVPFITAGDRGLAFTKKAILTLDEAGADAIELGVPFSDPLADGPVIQRSSQRALEQGTTLPKILGLIKEVRLVTDIPIILMGYFNPFLQPSLKNNMIKIYRSGADGLIIPDFPPEEAHEAVTDALSIGLDMIFLAAPTSTDKRLKTIGKLSQGYVYYISVAGTTGTRQELSKDIKHGVQRVKKHTSCPVLVGFGISTAQHAKQIIGYADGVIVGSALVKAMENAKNDEEALKKLSELAKSFVKAVKQ